MTTSRRSTWCATSACVSSPRTSPPSTSRCTRPSPTCAPSRPWWRRRASRSRWGPSTARTRMPAPARARSARACWPGWGPATSIVGHSERRTLFGMTDATVAATLRAVLRHDMTPIVCVGETEDERAAGKHRGQAGGAGAGGPRGAVARARRRPGAWPTSPCGPSAPGSPPRPWTPRTPASSSGPWWAKWLVNRPRRRVRIQYGGSVQGENATELMAEPNVDGLLVGGASLQAASFLDVIRAGAACYRS